MKELEELAEQLEGLRERIARCRRGRHGRSRLPAELWKEAATWAKKLGAYRASRALGVRYATLRSKASEPERRRPSNEGGPAFVEFSGAQLLEAHAASGAVVEVADASGARLTIRMGSAPTFDVAAVVAAFRGGRR